jgi:hypothetical protein
VVRHPQACLPSQAVRIHPSFGSFFLSRVLILPDQSSYSKAAADRLKDPFFNQNFIFFLGSMLQSSFPQGFGT